MTDATPKKYIRVRDRRQVKQFSIHNRVIDEWLPIIGSQGYTLYSLYVRMANASDEGCYPSYSMIAEHLTVSRSTISDHNRLLTWCRLLHIDPGNQRISNNYYILDIPRVTTELLHQIQHRAQAALPQLRFDVTQRINLWRPIQDLWKSRRKPKPEILRPGQMLLPLESSSTPRELSGTARELRGTPRELRGTAMVPEQSKVTILKKHANNNTPGGDVVDGWDLADQFTPEQNAAFQDLLRVNVRPQAAIQLVTTHATQLGQIQHWIDYTEHLMEEQDIQNPAGFIIAGLRKGEAALLPITKYRYGEDNEQDKDRVGGGKLEPRHRLHQD